MFSVIVAQFTFTFHKEFTIVCKTMFANMINLNTIVYLGTSSFECNEEVFTNTNSLNIKIYTNAQNNEVTSFCQKECMNTIILNGEWTSSLRYIITNTNLLN